ncbi:MAG: hypothetical protein AB7H90_01510 [Alphaproteobacteria bacterium]
MIRHALILAALLAVPSAEARPPFLRGGTPAAATGSSEAFGTGGTYAKFQNGQTFVAWPDIDTGAAGNDWRYKVVRSNAPIDAGNYGAATVIADRVFNNSGLLSGGDPDAASQNFTQANRQNGANAMLKLTDGGAELDPFTGLQVYTALASESAYYGVIALDCPSGTCSGSPTETYIGSVGPIAESVQTPRPILWAASGSRANNGNPLSSPAGNPVIFTAHQSNASGCGGQATGGVQGHYYTLFVPAEDQYYAYDGMHTTIAINQLSTDQTVRVGFRDSLWATTGNQASFPCILETFWSGAGFGVSPNPFITPNRRNLGTRKMLERGFSFLIAEHDLDPNQLHWKGNSMGAMGGTETGMRMDPRMSSVRLLFPVWQLYDRGSSNWPGHLWQTGYPFIATVAAAPSTLGSAAASVLLPDGTPWGGDGNYADTINLITSNLADDLPVVHWGATVYDGSIGTIGETMQWQIEALNAFRTADTRGFGFVWTVGFHDREAMMGVFSCDETAADSACVPWSKLQLDLAYPAFNNSSIDDDPGTGTLGADGIMDGDPIGCVNCGFTWNVVSDTAGSFEITIDNDWLGKSPTPRETTLASELASGASGPMTVTDGSVFASASANPYFVVGPPGSQEIFNVTSVSGNTVNFAARGMWTTNPLTHAAGATVRQYMTQPTAPNGGPYASMTVDVALRRVQHPWNGKTCTITPHGGSAIPVTPTMVSGIPTFDDVPINASGATTLACN